MTALALAGHTLLGFDVVMPLFSVCHESAAIGCTVNWGDRTTMPVVSTPLLGIDDDYEPRRSFLDHPAAQAPLGAITALRQRLGEDAAVCGKVFGPWTLGYHALGIEEFLVNTLLKPDRIRLLMDRLLEVSYVWAQAQIDAGADCLLVADHATADTCSPEAYREFLLDIHGAMASEIPCPLILHICGDTSDRLPMIAATGMDCFHWDTKLGPPERARELVGEKMSLMGGVNNPRLLREGSKDEIWEACRRAVEAGTDIVAPECAVPLDAPLRNLQAIGEFCRS